MRKLLTLFAAIVLPGGLVALLGTVVFKGILRTERGRTLVRFARRKTTWMSRPVFVLHEQKAA